MIKRLRLSPFLKDILLTTVTAIVMTVSIIITTRLLARGLGPDEFGAYSLARRMVATTVSFSTLAMGTAVARYIGFSKSRDLQHSYFLSGLVLILPSSLIIMIIGFSNINYLTGLVYHSQTYVSLFSASLFMVVGTSFYTVLSAFYRGQSKIGRFNLWRLGLTALVPLTVAWIYAESGRADLVVLLIGVSFSVSVIPLAFHSVKALLRNRNSGIRWQFRKLLRYGLPRTLTDFGFTGLFAMGPFLAPYFGSMKEAGYLAISQSVFRIAESGIVAFGLIALPKVARLVAEGSDEFLKERIVDIVIFIFHLGLFMTLHILLWLDQIVILWLGAQYMEAIFLMRMLLIALTPYLTYVMLRSIINAVEEKAINTLNLFIALATAFTCSLILAGSGLGVIGLAIGTTIGFTVLGVLSALYLWRLYQIKGISFMIKRCMLLNAVLIIVALLLKYWLGKIFSGWALVSTAFIVEGSLFALYYLVLHKWNVRWTIQLWKRIMA